MESMNTPDEANNQASRATREPFLFALSDLGMPVFLFGFVFLLLMVGITKLLSPDRFPVHIGGDVIRLSELSSEEQRLLKERDELTVQREELIASQDAAPALELVRDLRAELLPVGSVLLTIESVRAAFKTGGLDPISLPTLSYSEETKSLILGGYVTDPTGGSNHILAAFVDELRSLPDVTSVSEPEYVQEKIENGILRTPFTLTLRLSASSPLKSGSLGFAQGQESDSLLGNLTIRLADAA